MIAIDWRFVRFVLAGASSVPFNIGSRVMLSRIMPFGSAVILAHLVGMLVAFLAMKYLVFDRSGRPVASELVRFGTVNAVSLVQTWVVSMALLRIMNPGPASLKSAELWAHLAALGTTAVTSFVLHKRISFVQGKPVVGGSP